jgi:hypothetical protein
VDNRYLRFMSIGYGALILPYLDKRGEGPPLALAAHGFNAIMRKAPPSHWRRPEVKPVHRVKLSLVCVCVCVCVCVSVSVSVSVSVCLCCFSPFPPSSFLPCPLIPPVDITLALAFGSFILCLSLGQFANRIRMHFGSSGESEAKFASPHGITLTMDCPPHVVQPILVVADSLNARVQVFRASDGHFLRMIGLGFFGMPLDVAMALNGTQLVTADRTLHAVTVHDLSTGCVTPE